MRYLILSDIHSNDEALAAVLARVRRKRYDRVVVLGDFVGYGANPNQVIDRIRRMGKEKVMIRGNHDKVVCGLESGDLFNPVALRAARWTTEKLASRNLKFLEALPLGPATVDGAFAICHGSPRDEDAYIFTDYDAYLNFRELEANVCFFGHSHIPCVFTLEPHGILVELMWSPPRDVNDQPLTGIVGWRIYRTPIDGVAGRDEVLLAVLDDAGADRFIDDGTRSLGSERPLPRPGETKRPTTVATGRAYP